MHTVCSWSFHSHKDKVPNYQCVLSSHWWARTRHKLKSLLSRRAAGTKIPHFSLSLGTPVGFPSIYQFLSQLKDSSLQNCLVCFCLVCLGVGFSPRYSKLNIFWINECNPTKCKNPFIIIFWLASGKAICDPKPHQVTGKVDTYTF